MTDINCMNAVTIAAEVEINHAIATLVLAFDADPVARWAYPEPDQYLLHMPRMVRTLGASSFEARTAHRSCGGAGIALWLPPGVAGDDVALEAVVRETIVDGKQVDAAALFERTEHYRPQVPHWYLSLIGVEPLHQNKGIGANLLGFGLRQCDQEHRPAYLWSSNPKNLSFYRSHGFEVMGTIQVETSPPIFPMVRHAR
jgi:GNAT superfamily N-acetyltransferase